MNDFVSLWSYLSTTPLLWLTATIAAYLIAESLAARLGNPPWANPVLLSVLLLSPVLSFTKPITAPISKARNLSISF
jgi:putative effector of murein hydrolase